MIHEEEKFLEILFNAYQNIIIITKNNSIYMVNDTFYKYFDYKNIDEFRSKHSSIFDLAIKKDEYTKESLNTKKSKVSFETKNSGISTFVVSSDTMEVGTNKFIIHSFNDVTEFEESKTQAESAKKSMSVFLANMTHEIRTPINSIIGFSDLLLNTKQTKTQKKYSDIINKSSKSLLNIANSILDFSKLQNNKIELEMIPMDLVQEIDDVYNLLKFSADRKSLTFNIQLDAKLQKNIISDPLRLKQVLTNLLSNAIKFTDAGGSITMSANVLESSNNSQSVRISIKDTGIGIAKENIEKIFSEFAQEDNSVSRKYGGTGLGLAISKDLVYIFGSKLLVKSELDKGSDFYFDINFNMSKHTQETKVPNQSTLPISVDKLSILVVDDTNVNVILMKSILEHYDAFVDTAYDGKEAIQKVKNKNYDLVFMDINMPEMGGIEATKIIRKFNKDVKIIAISANIIEGDKKHFIDAGMNDYLTKPLEIDELERVLIGFNFNETFNATKEGFFLDNDTILRLYNSALEVASEIIEDIEDGIKNSDFKTIENSAYKLKSSSGSLKLDYIYDLSCKMEKDAIEHKEKNYTIYLDMIKRYFKFFKTCLEQRTTNI